MLDLSRLDWPFFEAPHRRFAPGLADWAKREVALHINHADVDGSCRALVRALGEAGPRGGSVLRHICLRARKRADERNA